MIKVTGINFKVSATFTMEWAAERYVQEMAARGIIVKVERVS